MSLWTPDGERPVAKQPPKQPAPAQQPPIDNLTPEQQQQAQQMAHELAEARAKLLETPANTVLANHAMGIYELAAIHLTADDPKIDEAQLAIDALAALLGELQGRLGEPESTLKEALQQIQLAFVQRKSQLEQPDS